MCNNTDCPGAEMHRLIEMLPSVGMADMLNGTLPPLSATDNEKLKTFLATETEAPEPLQKRPTLHEAFKTIYSATGETDTGKLLSAQHQMVDTWATKFAPLAKDDGVLILSAQFWDEFDSSRTCDKSDAGRQVNFEAAIKAGGYDGDDWTSYKAVAFPLHQGNDWFAVLVTRNEVALYDPTGQYSLDYDSQQQLASNICWAFTEGHAKDVKPACLEGPEPRVLLHFATAYEPAPTRHSAILALIALEVWGKDLDSYEVNLKYLQQYIAVLVVHHMEAEMAAAGDRISRNKEARMDQVGNAVKGWTQPVGALEKMMIDRVAWTCYTGELAGDDAWLANDGN